MDLYDIVYLFIENIPKLFCWYLGNHASVRCHFVCKRNARISYLTWNKDHCLRLHMWWEKSNKDNHYVTFRMCKYPILTVSLNNFQNRCWVYTVRKKMDFHPAIHECWRKNRLLQDFYPWIKICIWMHTHPLKPMVIHEKAHNNPRFKNHQFSKIKDCCVLIHGWPWASMDEYASICRFLSMDKNPAIGGYSANIHVWLDENPSNEHAVRLHSRTAGWKSIFFPTVIHWIQNKYFNSVYAYF